MAKYFGKIGFASTEEIAPGVWEEIITEREYFGDVTRRNRRLQPAEKVNDNIEINNDISIVADPYAYQNIYAIRYLWWMDTRWEVNNVTVEYPRLTLSIGGLYNGPFASDGSTNATGETS